MRILYVAKHNQPRSNDEEGAITFALKSLGHDVVCVHEKKAANKIFRGVKADLLLFHHWLDPDSVRKARCKTKVFWYFDLVDFPQDPSLSGRCKSRREWMERVIPTVDIGFCTDGDWVNRDTTGKLVRLCQGADSRESGFGIAKEPRIPILFTGTQRNAGEDRISWAVEMFQRYQGVFTQVQKIHGSQLADLIASSDIVIAPDGPITNHYWSNRVYLTLGFGGFLIHPYCGTLTDQYMEGREIVYYKNRLDMHNLISYYSKHPGIRDEIRQAGFDRTMKEHTYIHRCRTLTKAVEERL